MAYTDIPSGDKDPDSPINTTLVNRLDNNVDGVAAKDAGAPRVVGANLVELAAITLNNDAAAEFTDLAGYSAYLVIFEDIRPATAGLNLYLRISVNNGSSFISTLTYHVMRQGIDAASNSLDANSTAASALIFGINMANSAAAVLSGHMWLIGMDSTSAYKKAYGQVTYTNNNGYGSLINFAGDEYSQTANDVDAIQFAMSAGNLTSGVIRLYGVQDV